MFKDFSCYNVFIKWAEVTKLSILQTNSMYIDDSRVFFYISKLTKTLRLNFHQKPIECLPYPSEKAICVVRIIKLYSDKTANLRDKNRYSFFITFVTHMRQTHKKLLLAG